jgi:hypothetical protein
VSFDLFAKLFVVACAESGHRCTINAGKLASRIIVVKYVIGWIVAIFSNAIPSFNHMYAIMLAII